MSDTSAIDPFWAWGEDAGSPRLLHTMIRVHDIEASLRFYRDGLGMPALGRHDFEQGRCTIVLLSCAGYRDGPAALELTCNWDQTEPYSHGSGYGHVAIGVADIPAMHARLADFVGLPTSAPRSMLPGAPAIAFVKDPDGYAMELIQVHRAPRTL